MPKVVGTKKKTKSVYNEIVKGRRGNVIGRIAIPLSPKDKMIIRRLRKKQVVKI